MGRLFLPERPQNKDSEARRTYFVKSPSDVMIYVFTPNLSIRLLSVDFSPRAKLLQAVEEKCSTLRRTQRERRTFNAACAVRSAQPKQKYYFSTEAHTQSSKILVKQKLQVGACSLS